jgi:hypothetical protein
VVINKSAEDASVDRGMGALSPTDRGMDGIKIGGPMSPDLLVSLSSAVPEGCVEVMGSVERPGGG